MQSKIIVMHDNQEWITPLKERLEQLELPYQLWDLQDGCLALNHDPFPGVYFSRISASSHTRDHRFAPEYAEAALAWLEQNGKKVINGKRALRLEVSKVNQYMALKLADIPIPETIVAVGKHQIMGAAKQLDRESFIIKHNRAGKGLGVQLFHSIEALQKYVKGPKFMEPIDGITLIQQYIDSPTPHIIRHEFIGGKYFYSVKVDTSQGFELCPADNCGISNDNPSDNGESGSPRTMFEILPDYRPDFIDRFEAFLAANEVLIAGIETITDVNGNTYVYDVNTNTNYNPEAEAAAGKFGMLELAGYLGRELDSSGCS